MSVDTTAPDETIDLAAIEARLNAATPGPYRLLTRTDYNADARIAENGCSIVAQLGGLGSDGQSCWVLVDDSLRTPRMGPHGWGDLFAHAPEDLRALLAEVRRLTEERDAANKERNELRALQADQQRAFVAGIELAKRTARIEGATAMREAILGCQRWSGVGVQAILDVDPAAVVGSGSSIHAALPSPDTYQWSATGPNGCLLLSPADCIVARIDRDGTGWRPQIPGRGPLKWAADFPSAVRQVREVLGDVVPDGSAAVVGSGS